MEPDQRPERGDGAHASSAVKRVELLRIAGIALCAVAVWLRLWEPFAQFSLIGTVATLVGGYPILREALENLRTRRMTMELSMTIALVAALSIGQALTALIITAFVLAAEILEHQTVARGRAAIGDLLRCLPQTALVRRDGTIAEIAADTLRIGDAVLVNPGALVPVDGVVVSGHSFVDEARITGESLPAEKLPARPVYAGTINLNGALEVRAERLGRDTSFGRIINAVESAEHSQAPIERLADRLSGYLVYFALGAAGLTFILTRNAVATISVIIVAGACGIAAGTPLAILGAVGRAARVGAIVKGGRYLEALAVADIVVFDKTGTVTCGAPRVRSLVPAPSVSEQRLIHIAAIAELRSEHPLGAAIRDFARSRGITPAEPEAFTSIPGRGVQAWAHGQAIVAGTAAFLEASGIAVRSGVADDATSEIHVACAGSYLGMITIADALRAQAVDAVRALKAMAIRTVLLTGDRASVANLIGHELGIDEVVAEVLPDEKSGYIGALVDAGKIVVMVGDGVNDAPALTRATVGVAMGSGTDVARESADVVLLGNDLSRLVETMRIARRTKAIVMQNFAGTLAVDSVGIALAAGGILNPLLAAFIHVASELTFIANSTRMLPRHQSARAGAQRRAVRQALKPMRGE